MGCTCRCVLTQNKTAEFSLTDIALWERTVSVTTKHVLETNYRLHAIDYVPEEVKPLMLRSQLILASVASMYRWPAQVSPNKIIFA